jgi:hypothetical protein
MLELKEMLSSLLRKKIAVSLAQKDQDKGINV